MKIENIKNPDFLKALSINEMEQLSQDIRQFIIENVSTTGGHFSSNLGVVELTMALHYVFNSPIDKIIFDVGHQSYVHKILTGRAAQFNTLRKYGGLSGFQKRKESIHDAWEAGHSSTALSGGIGLAVSRDLNKEKGEIICVVGDGAIMSGESFEALNYLGSISSKVIVVLNDNNMSITKNVGGLSNFLSEVRISTSYKHAKNNYVSFLNKSGFGKKVYQHTKHIKDSIKENILKDNIFSEFGLDYLGPVDGHNLSDLINVFTLAKEMDHSVVVHVHTTKGKGYRFAEQDKQGLYHGVSPFDYHVGIQQKNTSLTSWSSIISNHVKMHMQANKDIVVITPAMISGSCLQDVFDQFPQRCFDVGITEEHAMTFAAGLSCGGKIPYITFYSSFLQRAYDQINHDIARMNLPCLIGIDRSGLVGADGETHHGVFDIGILTPIPNLVIMTPKDAKEAKQMINTAFANKDRPYVIRFPKGSLIDQVESLNKTLTIGQWEKVITHESSLTIITYDQKVNHVKSLIEKNHYPVNLVNARFLKPLDYEMLDDLASKNHHIIVYETDLGQGSLGSMMAYYYSSQHKNVTIDYMAIKDHYTPQGEISKLLQHEKIDIESLKKRIEEKLNEERKN